MKRTKVRSLRRIALQLLRTLSLAGLALTLGRPLEIRAATYITVTSSADAGGICPGTACTLRQAITTAAPGDTINFSLAANSTITLTSAELLITKSLTINGPGADLLTVQRSAAVGTPEFRIFEITGLNVTATIYGLTISNGTVRGAEGGANVGRGGGISAVSTSALNIINSRLSGNSAIGGINFASGNAAGGEGGGGGIYVQGTGTLNITNSTVSGNFATGGTGYWYGGDGVGGGIYIKNTGFLNITNSTVSGNLATGGNANSYAGSGLGGGIYTSGSGALNIVNSTLSGNSATATPSPFPGNGGFGGGILIIGTLNITSSTLSGNSTTGPDECGGGIYNPGLTNSRNTIIAMNASVHGPDVCGPLTSQGYNLIGNNESATITMTTGDQIGTPAVPINPLLGPLANNGGPTQTQALLSGSPAIERGYSGIYATDQRGFARPVVIPDTMPIGDGSDIGAYELQADQLPGCNTKNVVVSNNLDNGSAGSLRYVIADVCAGSTINFAFGLASPITLTNGELAINKALAIAGPGANLMTVRRDSAAPAFRIFNINPGIASAYYHVMLSGLTIANGDASGGGIRNNAISTVTGCAVSGNVASINSGFSGSGGGITNPGTLTVTSSTISGNVAAGNNSVGGGISNSGPLTITNSTIFGNSAAHGGGIANSPAFPNVVDLTNSTISGNSASLTGGGILNSVGTFNLRNTIIAVNAAPAGSGEDFFGAVITQGFNLIGNSSGATIAPVDLTDQIGTSGSPVNPLLGPLAGNGGPTLTQALLAGSSAINRGHSGGSTTDQRGFPRPLGIANVSGGDGSDIGAFEAQAGLLKKGRGQITSN